MHRYIYIIILGFLLLSDINSQITTSYNETKKIKAVIIINNGTFDDKVNIENFLQSHQEDINFEVDTVFTEDNYKTRDFKELNNYITSWLISRPEFTIYININNNTELELCFSEQKNKFPIHLRKKISEILNLELKTAYNSILYILDIKKENKVINTLNNVNTPVACIIGDVDPVKILKISLLDTKGIQSSIYMPISFIKRVFYLNEKVSIIIFILFILFLSTLITTYSKRIKFHIRQNRRYIYTLFLKSLALFSFFFISTLVIEHVTYISGDSNLVFNYPKSFFIIKNLIIFFIYGICFHVIKDTSFSKSPYFYSYISFFISISIFLILISISIPFGLFQILPIVSIILFISSKHRSSKRFFLVASPVMVFIFFNRFLRIENTEFINLFIHSRFRGNIILTMLALPYIFLQDSYHRFLTRRQNKLIYRKDIVFSILTLMVTITYIAILLEFNKL